MKQGVQLETRRLPKYLISYESGAGPRTLEITHPSPSSDELRRHLRSTGTSYTLERHTQEAVETIETFPHSRHEAIMKELRGEVEEI